MAKLDYLGEKLLDSRIKVSMPYITGRLLDLGCGTNKLVRNYRGEGVGVDVFDFGDVDLIVEDSSKIPFEDESFDTITILAALNHIPNRERVLQEMHRLLKPDGKLLVTMISPLISFCWHTLRAPWDRDQKERGMEEGEVYGITPQEMIKMLETAGFCVQSKKRFMLGLNRLYIVQK
ncbi:MAG: methyltransferase domain-containing protein [Candidatus Magasanikbacteria bacterium]|nr:methyltransferase domain-containing protein [Candidatus Magasanikbacteria bacterium]